MVIILANLVNINDVNSNRQPSAYLVPTFWLNARGISENWKNGAKIGRATHLL